MPLLTNNLTQRTLVCGIDNMYSSEIYDVLKLQQWQIVKTGQLGNKLPLESDGLFDSIVINAATDRAKSLFLQFEDQEFFDRCVTGLSDLFITLQDASKLLRKGGSIIVIGSRAYAGIWYATDRSAWSAALIGLCRSLAVELRPDNKRVNVICAELTDKPPSQQVIHSVAATTAFLASEGSAGINGEHFVIDNAASLQMREARQC